MQWIAQMRFFVNFVNLIRSKSLFQNSLSYQQKTRGASLCESYATGRGGLRAGPRGAQHS